MTIPQTRTDSPFPGDLFIGGTKLASCQPCLFHPRQKVLLKDRTISSLFKGVKAWQLVICFICHQRRWEVDPAEGGDNGSWGHTLHWRRLWVRYLLPHQIPCGATKGFYHIKLFLLLQYFPTKYSPVPPRVDTKHNRNYRLRSPSELLGTDQCVSTQIFTTVGR